MTLKLRASRLPLFFRCAASANAADSELTIDLYNDAAELGTAVHVALRDPETDIPAPPGVDADEYYRLVRYGKQAWFEHIAALVAGGDAEVSIMERIGDVILTGHADRFNRDGAMLTIVDWKSGRVDTQPWEQMLGYALLAMRTFAKMDIRIKSVRCLIVWLRDQEIDTRTFTASEVERFEQRLIDQTQRTGTFAPGPHCVHCPRAASCPGRQEFHQSAIQLMRTGELDRLPDDPAALGPAVARGLELVKYMESCCAQFREAARALVQQHGQLPTVEGKALRLVPQNRRELDPMKAWPILTEYLDEQALAPCVKVSISKVEQAVASKAGRGKGAAAKRELNDALEAAGAVSANTIQLLKEVSVSNGNAAE